LNNINNNDAYEYEKNRQIKQAKQSNLLKQTLKGRLPKTLEVTLNLSINVLDRRQELSQQLDHRWTTRAI